MCKHRSLWMDKSQAQKIQKKNYIAFFSRTEFNEIPFAYAAQFKFTFPWKVKKKENMPSF